MKRLFKHFMLPITATLVFLSLLFSCSVDDKDKNKDSESEKDKGSAVTGDEQSPFPTDKTYQAFSNWNYESFAKVRVISVDDAVYTSVEGIDCIGVRCEIIEDYYRLREEGEQISVALITSFTNEDGDRASFDKDAVRGLILDADFMIIHLTPGIKNYFADGTRMFNSQCYASLSLYQSIPINDGKLGVSSVDKILSDSGCESKRETLGKLDTYLIDGINESQVRENLTRLDTDIELEFRKMGYLCTNKRQCEVVSEEKLGSDITYSLQYDLYLNVTFTVKNNTERNGNVSVFSVRERDGEWDADNSQRLITVSLSAGEEKQIKLPRDAIVNGKTKLELTFSGSEDRTPFSEIVIDVKDWTNK